MRLKPFQIKLVCQKILLSLRTKQLIELTKSEPEILERTEAIFTDELKIEDKINEEAEKLLAQYSAKMGTNIDKEQMFNMIKKQLIKDKKVVL